MTGTADHVVARSEARSALLVAAVTLRDTLRRRSSWTATLALGALFAVVMAGFGAVTDRVEARSLRISYRVAVDGDIEGGHRFLEDLAIDRLALTPSEDAARDVTESVASAGIRLPERLDERLDRGEPVEIPLYYRARHDNSVTAYNTLVLRIGELENQRLGRAAGDEPTVVDLEEHLVASDPRVSRLQLARTLAALSTMMCLGVVSSVAAVFGSGRERRTAEPLLLLPMTRRMLAAGITVGAYPVAATQLVAAVTVLVCVSALPVAGLGQPLDSALSMLAYGVPTALLLGLIAAATGCLAGSLGTGSDDAVGLGDFLSLPFILVGVMLLLEPELPSTALTYSIPALGPALALRDGISGSLTPPGTVLVLVTTVGWSGLLVGLASRWVGDERRILRSTS